MATLYPYLTGIASPAAIPALQRWGYSAGVMPTLHQRMRSALEASGLSQSEVARRIGVRSQSVNQWLSGAQAPSRENLLKFVDVVGANLGWLLYGKSQLPIQAAPNNVVAGERPGGVGGRQ